jgi:hypothetical protein
MMRSDASANLAAAALACFAASLGFGVVALATHWRLSALGPICGLNNPAAFFAACPACPAAMATACLALTLAGLSVGLRHRILPAA